MKIRIVKSYDGKLYLEIDEIRTSIYEGFEDLIDEFAELKNGASLYFYDK